MINYRCHASCMWAALCLFACAVHSYSREDSASSNDLETLFGKERWEYVRGLVSKGYSLKDQQGYYSDQDELLKCFVYLRENIRCVIWYESDVPISRVEPRLRTFNELARQEWARGLVDDLLLELADEALQKKQYDEAIKVYEKILSDCSDGVPCVEWLKFADRDDSEPEWDMIMHTYVRVYPREKIENPGRTTDLARAGKAIALLKIGRFKEVIELMNAFLELRESPPLAFGGDYPPVVEAYCYKAIALEQLGASMEDLHALRGEMILSGLEAFLRRPQLDMGKVGEVYPTRLGVNRLRTCPSSAGSSLPVTPKELYLSEVQAGSSGQETTGDISNGENGLPDAAGSTTGHDRSTSRQDGRATSTELPAGSARNPQKAVNAQQIPELGPNLGEVLAYIAAAALGLLGLGIALFHLVQHARLK